MYIDIVDRQIDARCLFFTELYVRCTIILVIKRELNNKKK